MATTITAAPAETVALELNRKSVTLPSVEG
jgi:hypothetical protein